MGVHSVEKNQLSAKGMLVKVRSIFKQIPEPPRDPRSIKSEIPLTDNLSAIRKIVLNAFGKETTLKGGIATKQCAAACWSSPLKNRTTRMPVLSYLKTL